MIRTDPRPRIVVLAGPTGTGKTGLSLPLAAKAGAQIINADSMQVYRGLDIGTAKATPEEQSLVPHHLLDVVDPDQDFDAARFLDRARPLISDLARDNIPALVVGGTGLYLRSLIRGLFEGPGRDPAVRKRLEAEADRNGREMLHRRLAEVDPHTADRLHPNDLVRVIRALEVYEAAGRTLSSFHDRHALAENPYQTLFLCLYRPMDELKARIEARTDQMLAQGLVEEVQGLLARGFGPDLKPMRSIGYKEVVRHLLGGPGLLETRDEIVKQTRKFAKRQMTWFRRQPDLIWVGPSDSENAVDRALKFWADT